MRNRMIQLWCVAAMAMVVSTLGASAQSKVPTALKSERPGEWWHQRHAEKVLEAQAGDVDLLLIGDSITHYAERDQWYGYYFGNRKVMNLGFGGDRTQNVLWRLQNGEIDGLNPKLVSIMIGTNNSGRDQPEAIFLGIQAIVKELRQRLPESKIVVFSIFPRKAGQEYDTVKAVNKRLSELGDDQSVMHVDINEQFLNSDGSLKEALYYKDLLHLGDKGYQLWWSQLEPFVSQALSEEPLPSDPPRAILSAPRNGPRHEQKVAECALGGYELVFVGDSITHFWERDGDWGKPVWDEYYQHRKALNLGFGGDRTEWVNWRLQNGEIDGLSPKVTVLMIGTNNTHVKQDRPEDTLAGIESNIRTIQHRMPESKILLLSIFPRGETPEDPLRRVNEQVNRELPTLAQRIPNVFHLNINDAFLDANGTLSRDLMPDRLHPNTKGYQVWAEAMEPMLSQLLGEK
jgi:lysophospholipase L1-like esterase